MSDEGSNKITIGSLLMIAAIVLFFYKYVVFLVRQNTVLIITRFGKVHRIRESGIAFLIPFVETVESASWTINKQMYFEGYRIPLKIMWQLPLPIVIDGLEHKFFLTCHSEITKPLVFLNASTTPMERFYSDFFGVFNKNFQVDKFSWDTFQKTMGKVLVELAKLVDYGIVMESINMLSYTEPAEEVEIKKQAHLADVNAKLFYEQRKVNLDRDIAYLNLLKEKVNVEGFLQKAMVHNAKELAKEVGKE